MLSKFFSNVRRPPQSQMYLRQYFSTKFTKEHSTKANEWTHTKSNHYKAHRPSSSSRSSDVSFQNSLLEKQQWKNKTVIHHENRLAEELNEKYHDFKMGQRKKQTKELQKTCELFISEYPEPLFGANRNANRMGLQ